MVEDNTGPKIVEGHATLEGKLEDLLSNPPSSPERPMEGQTILIVVPQQLDNNQFALVVVGEAEMLHGVKLVGNGVELDASEDVSEG